MPIIGWIRDLFGIQKDMYETKKTRLEIKKLELEDEKKERLITLATPEQVERYDPKAQRLAIKERARREQEVMLERDRWKDKAMRDGVQKSVGKGKGCVVLLLLALLLAVLLSVPLW